MADEPTNPTPGTDPTPEPSAGAPAPSPSPGGERTFTQAELNAFLARQKREILADAGDVAELRDKARRLDELEAQSKTELEREREAREKAEQEAARVKQIAEQRLVEAAVLAEAARQKAIRPEHLHRLIDTDSVTIGDDGRVTGVEEAVRSFLDANPEYVGRPGPPPGSADQGARTPSGVAQLTREELSRMTPAEIVTAKAEGRLAAVLAGGTNP